MFLSAQDSALNKNYNSLKSTLSLLHEASLCRDSFTTFHEIRVGRIAEILARELDLSPVVSDVLGRACCFHDIGKLGVSEKILQKRGRLTAEDFAAIQKHSQIGAAIFKKVKGPFCDLASRVALVHHEKMDGSGYPYGLKGYQIPLEGRIIGIADVYDALRSNRYYKLAFSHQKAIRIITCGDERTRPEHFDEKVLKAFERCGDRVQAIYTREIPAAYALDFH